MPSTETQGYCEACRRHVLMRKETLNHVLHLLLTVLLCGWWLPVWLLLAITSNQPFRCTRCGEAIGQSPRDDGDGSDSSSTSTFWGIMIALGVVLLIGILIFSAGELGRPAKPSEKSKQSEPTQPEPTKKTEPTPEPEPIPEPEPDLFAPQTVGDLRIGIDRIFMKEGFIEVRLKIENLSGSRGAPFGPPWTVTPTLTDEFGKTRAFFTPAVRPEGASPGSVVNSKGVVYDVLVFDAPDSAAKKLKLWIPASHFKREGFFLFVWKK